MGEFAAMLWKELLQVSNRGRFALQKVVLAGLLGTAFIFVAYGQIYMDANTTTYQDMSVFGRWFFLVSTVALAFTLSAAAMVFAAGIVTAETVRRRLPLLLVTPLGSGAIIGSKALSVFARVASGVLVALPMVALLEIFGGVDSRMIATAVVLILSNVWLYAWMGLAASVLRRTTIGAISLATGAAILWNMLPGFIYVMAGIMGHARGAESPWLFGLSPLYEFTMFVEARLGLVDAAYHVGVNGILGAVFMATSFLAFRPMAIRRASGEGGESGRGFFLGLGRKKPTARPAGRAALAGFFGAGMIGKELASSRAARRLLPILWFMAVWGFVILVSVSEQNWPELGDADFEWGMFMAEAVGVIFLLSIYASNKVAAEKESMTFQTLALTRLGALRVLGGKAASVIVEQAAAVAILFAHMVLVASLGGAWEPGRGWRSYGFGLGQYVFLAAGLAFSIAYSTVVGIYFSLASRKPGEALVATGLAWFGGVYAAILPILLGGAALGAASDEDIFRLGLGLVPVALGVLGFLLVRSVKRGWTSILAFVSYALFTSSMYVLVTWPSKAYGDGELGVLLTVLPVSLLAPPQADVSGTHVSYYVFPILLGTFAWMAAASLASFEAEARKAA